MGRYDEVYATLADRAVRQGAIDLQAFMRSAFNAGIPPERLEIIMLEDLADNGPLFGRFTRTIAGAAGSATMAAERAGNTVGVVATQPQLQRLVDVANLNDVINEANPEILDLIDCNVQAIDERTWIAELVNTCNRCLPLHGISHTSEEWRELGKHPDSIHADWDNGCHCELVPTSEAAGRNDLVAPLVRKKVKSATGLPGQKLTQRQIAGANTGKALAAVEKAKDSLVGRRTMRLMGRVNNPNAQEQQTDG